MIQTLRRYRVITPLLVLLVLGAVAGFLLDKRDDERRSGPALFSRDADSDGTLALALWLERMGYDVRRLEWTEAVPSEDLDLLFLLRPTRRLRSSEADDLLGWINAGGVLVYHPNRFSSSNTPPGPTDGLTNALGLETRRVSTIARARVGLPLSTRPELSELGAGATLELELQDAAWVPLLLSEHRVLGATRPLGRGRVYAFTTPALFDNQRIAEPGNAEMILSILNQNMAVRRVAFDEYHHGLVRDPDLMTTVRSNPWGWSLLYAGLATLLFLVWGGRRFGPPLIPEPILGRSTGDYVSALAGLIQRARSVSWAQREYTRLLRRELSRLLGVRTDASLADLARVIEGRPGGASLGLVHRLRELEGSTVSERALLDRVRDSERDLRVLRGVEEG
ncbi:MAG: DUF4350 domain-containing protein [Chloroflexota bacterium]